MLFATLFHSLVEIANAHFHTKAIDRLIIQLSFLMIELLSVLVINNSPNNDPSHLNFYVNGNIQTISQRNLTDLMDCRNYGRDCLELLDEIKQSQKHSELQKVAKEILEYNELYNSLDEIRKFYNECKKKLTNTRNLISPNNNTCIPWLKWSN